jgi:hypothetical protein
MNRISCILTGICGPILLPKFLLNTQFFFLLFFLIFCSRLKVILYIVILHLIYVNEFATTTKIWAGDGSSIIIRLINCVTDFCAYVACNEEESHHIITANEGSAIGLAAGYHLATGNTSLVYLQVIFVSFVLNWIIKLNSVCNCFQLVRCYFLKSKVLFQNQILNEKASHSKHAGLKMVMYSNTNRVEFFYCLQI